MAYDVMRWWGDTLQSLAPGLSVLLGLLVAGRVLVVGVRIVARGSRW